MRLRTLARLLLVAAPLGAQRPAATPAARAARWREDLDSLVVRIERVHPNPWLRRPRADFEREAQTFRRDLATLDDAGALAGITRLVASLGDGHTGVVDLGTSAARWYPVRLMIFDDGLWITAIDSAHRTALGRRVLRIGDVDADEATRRAMRATAADNDFGRRQGGYLLSNVAMLRGLGVTRQGPLRLVLARDGGGTDAITLDARDGTGALDFRQWGEMFGPPGTTVRSAFEREPDQQLHPEKNADLPYHVRGRRAWWWAYDAEHRTLFYQLNALAPRSKHTKESFWESLDAALAFADSQPARVDRLVLDLRYASGGDGSMVPRIVKAFAKREDTVAREGRFFVLTSGKTFSAAVDLLIQLMKYTDVTVVGEPAGAPLNSSGDAGSFRLPNSRVAVSLSTEYHQGGRTRDTSTVIPVEVPAPMTGAAYFARRDPALDAIWSAPVPMLGVVATLRDSGGAAATRLWREQRARNAGRGWWQPFRWQELNDAALTLVERPGRAADGVAGLEINAERAPDVWEVWDSLGEGLLKIGRNDEALAAYRRALKLAPDNWNAAAQRKIVESLSGAR